MTTDDNPLFHLLLLFTIENLSIDPIQTPNWFWYSIENWGVWISDCNKCTWNQAKNSMQKVVVWCSTFNGSNRRKCPASWNILSLTDIVSPVQNNTCKVTSQKVMLIIFLQCHIRKLKQQHNIIIIIAVVGVRRMKLTKTFSFSNNY